MTEVGTGSDEGGSFSVYTVMSHVSRPSGKPLTRLLVNIPRKIYSPASDLYEERGSSHGILPVCLHWSRTGYTGIVAEDTIIWLN